ncbi:unnamed protein product [Callosobruchus maculatus]|uniref:Coiled-coil domain-containing protein 170 n=1 Tax=Callosobruchus maculatus TaxID=64391 RepID=A0A653C3H5_CALMS|nr:unnamed protein product [Callosobruchus maculatus]
MEEAQPPESVASGNTEEDWHVYEVLCKDMKMEDPGDVDVTTSLRSEIAALQYKRDRLQTELEEMRSQVRSRDQRCLELHAEAEQLREQSARQGAIVASLKKRVHELEERERGWLAERGRQEMQMQTALREVRYNEEKVKELEARVRNLEMDLSAEEQKKESARLQLQDFVRRLSIALGADISDYSHVSPETLVHKATELVQETSRLKSKAHNLDDTLRTLEMDLRTCRENLERTIADRESLQRQTASQILEIDRLRQEKESLEMQQRVTERELNELKEKLSIANRTLGSATGNISQQESMICQLRDELKVKDEKIQRLQVDNKHTLESLAIILSTPSRFVDSIETSLKDRIHEILDENKEKTAFMNFLDRLARALNMDEISHDLGVDLHTESLLMRAEQLARLESEKLVDKTAMVYQLQRRVRNLREQVQRKDLHLDLLRRKLSLQEDTTKAKCLLQQERDEANARVKKLVKQITALERGRKIEELQKRLIESESLRTKYNRKVQLLKDQVRTTGDTIEQERTISEHSIQLLRDELARVKETLADIQRREAQLQSFKHSIAKILGAPLPMPDYELISRLQKLVDAHHDFTLVSRRYDDPALRLTARSPTLGSRGARTPDRSLRYDDSGYADVAADISDDVDDDLFKTRTGRL